MTILLVILIGSCAFSFVSGLLLRRPWAALFMALAIVVVVSMIVGGFDGVFILQMGAFGALLGAALARIELWRSRANLSSGYRAKDQA